MKHLKLYYNSFKKGADVRCKKIGQKHREICIANGIYQKLDRKTSTILQRYNCKSKHYNQTFNNRVKQSKKGIQSIQKYKWVRYGDIKNAYYSSNIFLLIMWNLILSPSPIIKSGLGLTSLYCSKLNASSNLKTLKRFKLRFGISTTEELFRLTQINIFKVVSFINKWFFKSDVYFQIYVDDFVFYGNDKKKIQQLYNIYKFFNRLLLIEIHEEGMKREILVRTDSRGQIILNRLGIIAYRTQKGNLVVKIREETIKKYLTRFRRAIKRIKKEKRERQSKVIYREIVGTKKITKNSYPILYTFPVKMLWTDHQQRQKFISSIVNICRRHITKYKNLSNKEILARLSQN